MKKILSGLICTSILFSSVVLAQENTMQNALLSVKSKVTIPQELTEFDSRSFNSDEETQYYFTWHNEEGTMELEVSCNNEGFISSYRQYTAYTSDEESVALSGKSRDEAKVFAENFIKKALPEAFSVDDFLICDSESGSINRRGTRYSFGFIRQKNDINVSNNNVSVDIIATPDTMYVNNMWVNYDHTAEFLLPETEITSPEDAYKATFPLKLHYIKDYEASQGKRKDVTELIYSLPHYGRGYISAETGEEMTENFDFGTMSGGSGGSNEQMKEESAMADSATNRFSEQELAELEAVAELKSPQEIEAALRSLAQLKMEDTLTLKSYDIHKNTYTPSPLAKNQEGEEPEDKYIINLRFENADENRYLNASADAKTGEITYINNRKYDYDRPYIDDSQNLALTEEQKKMAETKADDFFALIAPRIYPEYAVRETTSYDETAQINFIRLANGVEYSDNSASISYDVTNEMLTHYSVAYSEAEFAEPAPAIAAEEKSYDILLEKYPLEKIFIRTDSKKYELCYQLSGYAHLNALTGEIKSNEARKIGGYTDISGHWSEMAINALSDVGIGISGTEFKPDEPITRAELLSIFADGIQGYSYYNTTEIMDEMKRIGILPKEEPVENGDKPVMREDACVYMIRFAGHEKIARLDIYKTEFADGNSISEGKLGYAAILSGLGIVSGHGGQLRPKENLTRAEAAMMLYKYLLVK